MSDANAQAFNIKAYVNNLLGEKRELEAANSALETEKTKLKQGILKYGEIAKGMEAQNKEQAGKIMMLQRQVEALQQENAKLSASTPTQDYTSEIADTLLFAQRTAKQLVAEAEQKADIMSRETQSAVNGMFMSVTQIREILRKIGNDISLIDAHLETLKGVVKKDDRSSF